MGRGEGEGGGECVSLPGLKSTISIMRLYSVLSILTTFSGSTNFLSVTEATADTPELLLEGRMAFPVFPSNSTPDNGGERERGREVCVHTVHYIAHLTRGERERERER